MADRDHGGLLARWSQRKAAARRGKLPPEFDGASEVPAEATAAAADATVPDEVAPDLPDPDTLDATADFKAYLKPGVPPELKTRALRRLWRVNPVYNRLDGLDDYCEDYTDRARVVQGLKTVYRVGRGMIERVTKVADDAPPADAPAAAMLETEPEAVEPDERQEPEKLPDDHEHVSGAGMAGSTSAEPTAGPLARPQSGQPMRRRLPRRG